MTITLSGTRKWMFSLGDLTAAVPLTILGFFQLYFLTDVARIPPGMAAWSILVVKLWDAVNDPVLGALSDRFRSRGGRRRVPMLAASVPLGLTFCLLWIVPPFRPLGAAVWYAIVFLVFDTCFTMFHVSFNALTPVLARDYDERSSLNGYRMVFSIAGTLAAVILMTVLSGRIEDARARFALAGIGLGLFCMIPPWFAYKAAEGFDEEGACETPGSGRMRPGFLEALAESTRAVLANRPFRQVMGLYLFSWTTTAVISSALVYFVSYYLRAPAHSNYLVLAAEVSAIAFIPLVVAAARRWDKRRAFMAGCAAWAAVQGAISLLAPGQLVPAYALAVLIGLGIATAYVLPWAMIPDVIELDTAASGRNREGSYYAFASFFQKLGTGAALWLMARALEAGGYVTPTAAVPFPEQPQSAIRAIRLFMGLAPAVLLA
ncbi:MAG TPA: MFS transporter, partial [Spirochaetia bacterium]|nr:MFS transporter [Spirochaetia bacterium]